MSTFKQSRTPLLAMLRKAFATATINVKQNADEIKDASRRRFVGNMAKAGVAAGFAGFLNACSKVSEAVPNNTKGGNDLAKNPTTQTKIVIIGAGIAGLSCAHWLKKEGLTASVYEASSRSGGRIFTKYDVLANGVSTEFGGEFIDSSHYDMRVLAKEFNLPLYDLLGASEDGLQKDSYFFDGRFYSIAEVITAFEPYAAQIQADIDALPDSITFKDYGNAAYYDNMSIDQYFDNIGISGWIRRALTVAYLAEYGTETNDQSCINFLFLFSPDTAAGTFEIFGSSDERYKIQGGNQQLTNALYKKYQQNIHLQMQLVSIKEAGTGYKLYFANANGIVEEIKADIVVMTIPFSVLRHVDIQVSLPSWKRNAINNLGYGTNAKLMMGFDKKVWRQHGYCGYVFTDGIIQNGWDSSQLQPGTSGGYSVFQGGLAGLQLANGTAASLAPAYVQQLESIWPGCGQAYSGKAITANWPTNPYSLGSYACYKPGQWTTIAGAEGASIGNLLFAGEHCSLMFQGFMNGGAQTGRRAAIKIKKIITQNDKTDIIEAKPLRLKADNIILP